MSSHVGLMLVFSAFVSVVFAVLAKDDVDTQLRTGVILFAGFGGAGILLGWLMFPFPL